MTVQAQHVLKTCDAIAGYTRYITLIKDFTEGKEIIKNGMRSEVERCKTAVETAHQGKTVAMVSSGDSGVYGMAGLILEIVQQGDYSDVEVEIVPGVTSANACASVLGAPLMHDYVTISLSDWLTERSLIDKRLHAIGQGDFIAAIYNPRSKARPTIIDEARDILLQYKSADTPVGLVKNAYREGQQVVLTTLGEMLDHEIGMLTTIIVGNAQTYIKDGKMITPRGYGL